MYLKFNEDLYKKITAVTYIDYGIEGDMLPTDSVESMLEDLLWHIERIQEEYDDFKQDVADNYKPISYAEQIGYDEREFI